MTPLASDLEKVTARVTRRLLPFLLVMYVLAFLDRANIGFARQAFQADTGLSDTAYAFGAGLFFAGYAALEIPSNLLLHRLGARLWLSRIMISWGIVSAAMAWARTPTSFYTLRFLLGVTEAGFFPGIVYYLCHWYPTAHRGKAMGYFYFGPPLAFILGGPLSGLLLEMNGMGGLAGWQWMFLVEGLLASIMGWVAFGFLENSPEKAAWLSAMEKATLLAALPPTGHSSAPRNAAGLLRALGDPRGLHLALIYFLTQVSVYGVTFYLPTQVADLVGRKVGLTVSLVTAIPWLAALAAAYAVPRGAARSPRSHLLAAGTLATAAVGMLIAIAPVPAGIRLAGLCLSAGGFIGVQPVFWSLATTRFTSAAGAAAAGSIALVNSVGNLGGLVAPNLRARMEAIDGNRSLGMISLAAAAGLGALLLAAYRPRPMNPPNLDRREP